MQRRQFLTGSALAAFGVANGVAAFGLAPPIGSARAAAKAAVRAKAAPGTPKPPTAYTKAVNEQYLRLPFGNTADFNDAYRDFIAGLPDGVIKNDKGEVVFNAAPFEAAIGTPTPDTVNPSLWRIFQLNGRCGLFKVTDGLYQIRNIDVANMTIMEGKTGLIVIDCTTTAVAAKAALDLYYQERHESNKTKPVKAVIFTHSHVDHYGGVGGIVTPEAVKSGDTRIIAPSGFTDEAVSENLYAGNAMYRRATYMYGSYLPIGPGAVHTMGSGLGVLGASQSPTLFTPQNPDDWVTETGQTKEIDGVLFEFLMAPGSEAPSEMHFYTPHLKALCTAENAVHTLHNFYTLRGAKTRDMSKWVRYLNQTLDLWGDKAEILYAPHHWPISGKEAIVAHIENYRDAFKFIHDRSLHLANKGYTLQQLGEAVKLPDALAKNWSTRGYYGTVSHSARAVYNFYLGFFVANPADLNPLTPPEAAPRYVALMGGAGPVLKAAQKAYDAGDYRWTAQLLLHLVYTDPNNQEARNLQADAFEQLGYQSEAATWRNFYFVGAYELRNGVPTTPVDVTNAAYLVPNLTLELTCNYVGIAFEADSNNADAVIKINLDVPEDTTKSGEPPKLKEQRSLVLKNRVINSRATPVNNPDLTLTGSVTDLNAVLLSGDPKTAEELLKKLDIKTVGYVQALLDLLGMMSKPEFWFPIITPVTPA